jgi:hypothetical protein
MLKKLLYLYNDGHNPFPKIHGEGVRFDENMNPVFFADEVITVEDGVIKKTGINEEEALRLNGEFEQINQEHRNRLDYEHGPQTERETLTDLFLNALPDLSPEEIEEIEWRPIEELEEIARLHEVRDKELFSINTNIEETRNTIATKLHGNQIDWLEGQVTDLEKEIKNEKKKIIINNLERTKIKNTLLTDADISSSKFSNDVSKNKVKGINNTSLRTFFDEFFDTIINYNIEDLNSSTVMDVVYKDLTKDIKLNHDNETSFKTFIISKSKLYKEAYEKRNDKNEVELFSKLIEILLKEIYPKDYTSLTNIDEKNNIILNNISTLQEKEKVLQRKIAYVKTAQTMLKEETKEYNDRSQFYKRKEQDIKYKYKPKPVPKLVKPKEPEEPKQQKVKTKKPVDVKPSETDKQLSLLKADAINRIENIEKTMSHNGKDLEKYLSGNGQSILQVITGDKSKVHDNEFNKSIPDQTVVLNNGKHESLRKAVTLDLYNDNNIFEIKNYAEYSIHDLIIPLQETKLEGTGYFVPYYLENGNLYNIELHYTDSKTGESKTKFILPETENGRELHVIYRLKEGLFEFKPLDSQTQHVGIQKVATTTRAGQPLYKFKNTTLQSCKDHHGNPSFNVAPYLQPIKI